MVANLRSLPSLKLTAKAHENRPSQKETLVFQPSIFRGELLVSGRVIRNKATNATTEQCLTFQNKKCLVHDWILIEWLSIIPIQLGTTILYIQQTLNIQIPPEKVFQVCFGGPNTFSGRVWMSRETTRILVTTPRNVNIAALIRQIYNPELASLLDDDLQFHLLTITSIWTLGVKYCSNTTSLNVNPPSDPPKDVHSLKLL